MVAEPVGPARWRLRVTGTVQGVGFRPFVYAQARRFGLGGWVANDDAGVLIEVEGDPGALAAFRRELREHPPALARVEGVITQALTPWGESGFAIKQSSATGAVRTLVAPDTAPCAQCLAEIADPAQRRYRYAFTNCTNCGPRFTIVTGIPYDRPNTTMAAFPMCPACAAEYRDPGDRRFHAQPICCPDCGPRLSVSTAAGAQLPGDALRVVGELLDAGRVVAIKGLGGYHLAADAADERAVATLRERKHRAEKPFALLAGDLETVRRLAVTDPDEEALLAEPARPIVLLRRRVDAPVADSVAPQNAELGVMLPYTPLHYLLAGDFGRPLVLTSGNVSDEPIAFRDDDARERLAGIADAFLTHDRPIHVRTDDSVTRVLAGRPVTLRRSRGYVPAPLRLPWQFPRRVLACGAELKHTFCLGRGEHAFLSQHIGDLENYETYRAFTTGVTHLQKLLDLAPEILVHDLHPDYLSTRYALDLAADSGLEAIGVQHHHAHIAACLADNSCAGPAVGVAFDGLGFGADGTLWGGELLVADLAGFVRAGHLEPVAMPGGVAAIRAPWRMAVAYLDAAYADELPVGHPLLQRHAREWASVHALVRSGVHAPLTTSAGRLFDAVAALVGVRDEVSYEGQAAIELEQLVGTEDHGAYPLRVRPGPPVVLRTTDLIRAVVDDLAHGGTASEVAGRFHAGLAEGIVSAATRVAGDAGLSDVALSGGVFQNVVLTRRVVDGLTRAGLRPLTHHRVPPNDGGISLGQASIAGARDRARAAG